MKQYKIQSIESFNPQPETMRNTTSNRVQTLLKHLKEKGSCVSLMLDTSVRVGILEETTALIKTDLLGEGANFKKQHEISEEVRHIAIDTRGQSVTSVVCGTQISLNCFIVQSS